MQQQQQLGFPTSEGGHVDLGRVQSIMRELELACSSIQMHVNPAAAEATILSLSRSSQPYSTCQYILENSQQPNARFQAAAAIRDAALREWVFLTADDKKGLISFCLRYVIQHANSPEGYVQAKVSSVAAQMMKRGWLDFAAAEKEAYFVEMKQAFLGIYGVDAQFAGINFIESLVSEFSPSTSIAMGLPREFHEKCRSSLEQEYLKTLYTWAQDAALSVSNRIVESGPEVNEAKVCAAALRLMLQILNWDFRYISGSNDVRSSINVFSAASVLDIDPLKRNDFILVQPGPSWRDVLISSGHTGWLLSLYGALRQTSSSENFWVDRPIAVSARKLIVQLCSLTGTIFPSDHGQMQGNHLLQLLSGTVDWIDPPDAVAKAIQSGKSESEMLDGCRVLLSIATVTTPFVFDQLLKSTRPFGTLSLLSTVMCEVLKDLMANNTEEESWSWVARDILLDTWTALLLPVSSTSGNAVLPPEGIRAAAGVFAMIVEAELKAASVSVYSDEDPSYYFQASVSAQDERLTSYALIARVAIEYTIPFLVSQFSERFARLHQVGLTDPTEILEELYSLLLVTGHVLADEGKGETPLVPKAILTHFVDYMEAEKHPAVVLSGSIIKFAEQSLNPEMRESVFSPRLMEAVIWFLSRWSSTYLMPIKISTKKDGSSGQDQGLQVKSQQSTEAFHSFFGEYNQGKAVLDIVVRISLTTFFSYPGEKDLQALTCELLSALVRRTNICTHLDAMDSWRDLANAFSKDRTLFSLNADHQRSLAETLVLSASGMGNVDVSNQHVRELMGHVTASLVDMCSKNDLKHIAQQPDVILFVTCLLERLRGASSATAPRIQKAIYDLGFSVMNPILVLFEVYKHEFSVVYLLLKFVAEWVEGQISHLESQETATVTKFSMRLLELYSSYNIGMISLSRSSNLLNEAKTEKYKDLRAILQLLTNLCSKDMIDFSSDSTQTNICQVVYLGLHIVTPLITLDLLKYPKLCHDYFTLVSHLLEVYPEMVCQLNSEAFAHIIGSIKFGIHNQDEDVVDKCLIALKALASYHYKETNSGGRGIASHAAAYVDSHGKVQEGVLSQFLHSVMQLLLFEDYSTDLVGSAADALLPLILCEQVRYQSLCSELIERQEYPQFRSRLTNALQSLTGSNNISSTLDRANYQKFRKNLHHFLVEVRGFLRTK